MHGQDFGADEALVEEREPIVLKGTEKQSESDIHSGVLSIHTNTEARKHFLPGV